MAVAIASFATKLLGNRIPLVAFSLGTLTSLLTIALVWRAQKLVAATPDPHGYIAMARSLLNGQGFAPYGSVLNRRGPLFPAAIALVYLVTGEHPKVLQLLQALMQSPRRQGVTMR